MPNDDGAAANCPMELPGISWSECPNGLFEPKLSLSTENLHVRGLWGSSVCVCFLNSDYHFSFARAVGLVGEAGRTSSPVGSLIGLKFCTKHSVWAEGTWAAVMPITQ